MSKFNVCTLIDCSQEEETWMKKEEFVLTIGKCVLMFKQKIAKLWQEATTENLAELGDLEGYRSDFHTFSVLDLMV
jgi:trans-2-enoyl-CoA reductase